MRCRSIAAAAACIFCVATGLAEDDSLDDDDEDDFALGAGAGNDQPIEAFTINSPKDISNLWHKAIMDQRKRGGKLDLQPGGDMYKRARKEASERLAVRTGAQKRAMAQNMLEAPARRAAIAGPSAGNGGKRGGATSGATAGGGRASTDIAAAFDASADGAVALSSHFNASIRLYANITAGAIANTGAMRYNSSVRDPQQKPDFNPLDTVWTMAQEMRERDLNASDAEHSQGGTGGSAAKFPTDEDIALREWFDEGGGTAPKLEFARADPTDLAARKYNQRAMAVESDATVEPGEPLLRVPLRLLMSAQSAKRARIPDNPDKTATYGDRRHLKDAFEHNQQWALAAFLLTQMYSDKEGLGAKSKWAPFLRTLRVHQLTKPVLRELHGSYAAELQRTWDDEARACENWISENICQKHGMAECHRDPQRLGSRTFSFEDYQWALAVVRANAVNVTKVTTGHSFMALVPLVDLLQHRQGVGGTAELGLDNVVTISSGEQVEGGGIVSWERPRLTDAETLLQFRDVSDESNPHNAVRLRFPGTQRSWPGMPLSWQTDVLRDWRKAVNLPPRHSDLWRNANELHLYGEDEDKEENEAMAQVNAKLAALGTDDMNAEEKLMMLGMADSAESAQLMVRGESGGGDGAIGTRPTQLYAAPDPEDMEDEKAAASANRLAEMALQVQGAAAVGHVDRSAAKVLNETADFFLHGRRPKAGLDDVDQMLLRKMKLLEKCGPAHTYKVVGEPHAHAVTTNLACAVRIHVMNESELDLFCNTTQGGWHDITCHEDQIDGGFNWTRPVSLNNERATLQALLGSVRMLLAGYKTSDEEDESLLLLRETLAPITRSAVTLRLREKQLLRRAVDQMSEQLDRLHASLNGTNGGADSPFQGGEVRGQAAARHAKVMSLRKREAERKARSARAVAQYGRPRPVVVLRLDLLKLKAGEVEETFGFGATDTSNATCEATEKCTARTSAHDALGDSADTNVAWMDPFEGTAASLRALMPHARRDAEGCFEYCARVAGVVHLATSARAASGAAVACEKRWKDKDISTDGKGLNRDNPSLRQCEAGFHAGYNVGCSWMCLEEISPDTTPNEQRNTTEALDEDAFLSSSAGSACAPSAHPHAAIHRSACRHGLARGIAEFVRHWRRARELGAAEDANTVMLVVRQGEHLRRACRTFTALHALPNPKQLAKRVEARARSQIKLRNLKWHSKLLLAMPVVVNGTLDVLAVHNASNVSTKVHDIAEEFALYYGLAPNVHEALARTLAERVRLRASKRLLARVPITAPDGRPLELEVRDGDQHDIDATIARFSIAQRLDVAKTVKALRKVVNKRLPKELGRIPIELGATQDDVVLRVSAGDVLLDLITSFCENFGLDNDMGNRVLAVARQRFS